MRSEGFEEWLTYERVRLRGIAGDTLARLASYHAEAAEPDLAIETGHRLLALDPLREEAHRALMQLYHASGRRSAALKQYRACKEILGRELGAEPELETDKLHDEIRSRRAPTAGEPRELLPARAANTTMESSAAARADLTGQAAARSDAKRIDRKLAAILCPDVVGYSKRMSMDEVGTYTQIKSLSQEVIDPVVAAHQGRVVKTTGDGFLVEFISAMDAVQCALALQEEMTLRNANRAREDWTEFRVGVSVGDVIVDGDDIYGDGVNVAARLEGLAEPGGICVSLSARYQIHDPLPLRFEDLGDQTVKEMGRPIRAFRVRPELADVSPPDAEPETPAALPLPDKPSIAVLPFQNMSADPDQEYFSDGITEDIIAALSRFRWFLVISRNSTFTYKGVKDVARELGVRYVLEGSVRRANDRVLISAQLIEAIADRHIWTERYDRQLDDIFATQDEITESIVSVIEPELSSAERERVRLVAPRQFDAWDCYQRGSWHLFQYNPDDVLEAQRLFAQAIEMGPDFSPAYSGLALAHAESIVLGYAQPTQDVLGKLTDAAQRAVALDARDARAHFALGAAYQPVD